MTLVRVRMKIVWYFLPILLLLDKLLLSNDLWQLAEKILTTYL